MTDPFFQHLESFLHHQGRDRGFTLDLGAGPGSLSNWVAAAGLRVIAFDIDQPSLYQAAAKHRAILGDAHCLPFTNSSFDKVICACVLEHIERPGEVVREIHRVLRSDGQLFLAVPCRKGIPKMFGSIYTKLAHLVMPKWQKELHLHIEQNFSFDEVVSLLESASFRIQKVTHSDFAGTALFAGNYAWSRPLHIVLSRIVEGLHLNFLTINAEFTCVREK